MSLNDEWSNRIISWRNELTNHFFRKLGTIEVTGFTTMERLSLKEALSGSFKPMPDGTQWGAKWEYGWFKAGLSLPEEARGKRITVRMNVGGESAVYINGRNAGARDREHNDITLCMSGIPGTEYQIAVESYAGHGPRICHAGPVPPGRQTVPEPAPSQVEVGESIYGIWEEKAYQLWIDVETLVHVRNNIDANSLRVGEIDKALKDFTLLVDFEQPPERMLETFEECRRRLKPLLDCVNGSTTPTMFMFGHSHIDVAWLWPLAETERKCARTFATQLALMEEYPEYKFLQSQPHLYNMVKMNYPDLYERIREKVASGQFIPDGGMWVEADTNLSGGESLIRQFIHGKRFFKEEFGVENEMLWLPDVFGYSGALPQIMRGCGIKYFATAKIFWAYGGNEPFPYNTFIWEGIDGSEILVHLCNDYNSQATPADVIKRWNERVQKDGLSTRMFPFGYGDGGGGPTRDHLEYIRRMGDLEGVPRTRMCEPVEYFRDQERRGIPDARYTGELYFAAHRGTYTSQAKTKKGNRKSEIALREAEIWGAAAEMLKGKKYPADKAEKAWKTVLLNQFHDIIPGSSIHRVYEEAVAAYGKVMEAAGGIAAQALEGLVENPDEKAVTIFNSLSWPRRELIELPVGLEQAQMVSGEGVPVQFVDGRGFGEVTIPSCGWTALKPGASLTVENCFRVGERLLENDLLRLELNEKGELSSIFDKESGRELAKGPCNNFRMFRDVTNLFDAWDIDSMYEQMPVQLDAPASVKVVCEGPLVAKILVERKLNNSLMRQEISLRRGSRRVEFKTAIDWKESHKLLKVAFPVDIHTSEVVNEIQFGHIRRPNHRSRLFDANRFEVCNHKWSALIEENRGFAVLNDCKYGMSALGNCITLTLLKSALAPDMTADKGMQEFTYAIYLWNGSFADCEVVREAYELNIPSHKTAGYSGEKSILSIDAPNIVIETVKPAEDSSGDIIVRMYECKRTAVKCALNISLPVKRVLNTDMLENPGDEIQFENGAAVLEFKPFEIKTIRLCTF